MRYSGLNTIRVLTSDNGSVSVALNAKVTCFFSMLPVLHGPFGEWAKDALPGEHDKDCHNVLCY